MSRRRRATIRPLGFRRALQLGRFLASGRQFFLLLLGECRMGRSLFAEGGPGLSNLVL